MKAILRGGPLHGVEVDVNNARESIHVSFVTEVNETNPSATPKPRRHFYKHVADGVYEHKSVP